MVTSLQSGLQSVINSLGSVDKKVVLVDDFFFVDLPCSKKYPYFLQKVQCQLVPLLCPGKAPVIDCIWYEAQVLASGSPELNCAKLSVIWVCLMTEGLFASYFPALFSGL